MNSIIIADALKPKVTSPSSYLHTHLSWIIDSGATDHMCCNRSLFSFLQPLSQPHSIGLPNGLKTQVTFMGDVKIHKTITLENVLYVPCFRYNLLLVSKLNNQFNTFLIFTDDNCMM